MENLELNTKEKKELEKRGFFAKEYLSFPDFISYLVLILWKTLLWLHVFMLPYLFLGGLSQWLFDFFPENTWIFGIILGIPIIFFFKYIKIYIFNGKIFYGKNLVIALGKKFQNVNQLPNDTNYISFGVFTELWKRIFYLWILGIPSIIGYLYFLLLFHLDNNLQILISILIIAFFIVIYIFRQIFEHYHPLYAFGNFGEKIQSLTPRIEEQSKQIQSEFQSEMNYSILSNGFDSLSATFSEIVSLVIKLEKVEARANKGNLFDSEKYINSLRSDIITPLNSLRTFLEKQKTELIQSQKELTRVRVGGKEGTENMELQSKRSESLIQELTENIEKLDVMIGKMG